MRHKIPMAEFHANNELKSSYSGSDATQGNSKEGPRTQIQYSWWINIGLFYPNYGPVFEYLLLTIPTLFDKT